MLVFLGKILKITKKKIYEKYKKKQPIVCLTSYTEPIARIADNFVDIILVGDSVGPVLYGFKSTKEVSLKMMVNHASAVTKNIKKSFSVIDMPFGTYEESESKALKNAKLLLKSSGADAVKLEGGEKISDNVKYLTKNKINVIGHLGMQPQSLDGAYKVFGRSIPEKKQILKDLKCLESSGAMAIVLECTIESLVKEVLSIAKVPVIGIGATAECDGQILVAEDLLGLTDFKSKFLKKYSNLRKIISGSFLKFSKDVKARKYPQRKHYYK